MVITSRMREVFSGALIGRTKFSRLPLRGVYVHAAHLFMFVAGAEQPRSLCSCCASVSVSPILGATAESREQFVRCDAVLVPVMFPDA